MKFLLGFLEKQIHLKVVLLIFIPSHHGEIFKTIYKMKKFQPIRLLTLLRRDGEVHTAPFGDLRHWSLRLFRKYVSLKLNFLKRSHNKMSDIDDSMKLILCGKKNQNLVLTGCCKINLNRAHNSFLNGQTVIYVTVVQTLKYAIYWIK